MKLLGTFECLVIQLQRQTASQSWASSGYSGGTDGGASVGLSVVALEGVRVTPFKTNISKFSQGKRMRAVIQRVKNARVEVSQDCLDPRKT